MSPLAIGSIVFVCIFSALLRLCLCTVLLDHALVNYGPEAKESRELLHRAIAPLLR